MAASATTATPTASVLPAAVLDAALTVATSAAMQAGSIIRASVIARTLNRVPGSSEGGNDGGGHLALETKSSSADLVTKFDKECETLVIEMLRGFVITVPNADHVGGGGGGDHDATATTTTTTYGPFGIMSEESFPEGPVPDTPTWIVDPIDGTTAFVHGSFDCCVSIGLAVARRSVLGVVYAPLMQELFTSVRGKGAYCNGSRIAASGCTDPTRAIVVTHTPYDRRAPVIDALMAMNKAYMVDHRVHAVRSYGSAAIDMCGVALGRHDVYVEVGICAWDMCAAATIVEEAGGTLTDVYGGPLDLMRRGMCCAATPALAAMATAVARNAGYREAMMGSA